MKKTIRYECAVLAGRCATGSERDAGKVVHFLADMPRDEPTHHAAICGVKPGRTSAGFYRASVSQRVLARACARCERAIEKATGREA